MKLLSSFTSTSSDNDEDDVDALNLTPHQRHFYSIAHFLCVNHRAVIVVHTILVVVAISGLVHARSNDDVRDYGPSSSRSMYEIAVGKEFFDMPDELITVPFVIMADDGGDLMREEYLEDVARAARHVLYELSMPFTVNNVTRTLTMHSVCRVPINCRLNEPLELFLDVATSSPSSLTYPTMRAFGVDVYIGNHVLQSTVDTDFANVSNNLLDVPTSSPLTSFNMSMLTLQMPRSEEAYAWLDAVMRWSWTLPFARLRLVTGHDRFLTDELARGSAKVMPFLGVGVLLLFAFLVACTSRFVDDAERTSRPMIAVVMLAIPNTAILVSFGALFMCGVEFKSICIMLLFLVNGLGVDDGFLMLHEWRRQRRSSSSSSARRTACATLARTAPSMTITSMTNAVSIAAGWSTGIPAIEAFATFGVPSIVLAWYLQCVVFTLALYAYGRREEATIITKAGALVEEEAKDEMSQIRRHSRWLRAYSHMCEHRCSLVACLLLLAVYWSTSVYSIATSTLGARPVDVVPHDSALRPLLALMMTVLYRETNLGVFFVSRPPDLRQRRRLHDLDHSVTRLMYENKGFREHSEKWWLPEYMRYLDEWHSTTLEAEMNSTDTKMTTLETHTNSTEMDTTRTPFTYAHIESFIADDWTGVWSYLIHIRPSDCRANRPSCLVDFGITFAFGGLDSTHKRMAVMKEWRAMVDSLPYNVTVLQTDAVFVDNLLLIDSTLARAVGVSLFVMCIILVLFIGHRHSLAIVAAIGAVFSIVIGVFGSLTAWGVNRDPILMTVLLVDIGISVDFISHLVYHFAVTSGAHKSRVLRIERAIDAVAAPLIQSATSSVLCISCLAFGGSYVTDVFAKCTVLLNVIGLCHTLVILPVILVHTTRRSTEEEEESECECSQNDQNVDVRPAFRLDSSSLLMQVK